MSITKEIFHRKLLSNLEEWKKKQNRKPLILRGARQVGKSTLVRMFGSSYRYFIELNLEKEADRNLFDRITEAGDLINAVFLRSGIPFNENNTLLFIDEIQESAAAIKMLRYLQEANPGLHIIAAGSLLEFSLKDVSSFPVGRIEQMVVHPFDFEEFLLALKRKELAGELNRFPFNNSLTGILFDLFHDYAIIGGMPEIVRLYIGDGNMINLPAVYTNLWQSFRDDVEKYGSNRTERKIIRHVIDTAPFEKDRITLNGFGNSEYRSREVGEALRALDLARIIQIIYPTLSIKPPLVPTLTRKPRLQFLDTGLLNHISGFQSEMIGLKDLNDFHRGKVIQHLVVQQYMANTVSALFKPAFWVRENANSNAEVDLLVQAGKYLIPAEVKSGKQGYLRSLHQFIESANHNFAIRLLANNLSVENAVTPGGKKYILLNLPYFLSGRLEQYAQWLISEYDTTGK